MLNKKVPKMKGEDSDDEFDFVENIKSNMILVKDV